MDVPASTPEPQPGPRPAPAPSAPAEPPAGKVGAPATPVPPPSSRELAVRAASGLGMYVWRWSRTGTPEAVVARAKASGISHLIVRASSQSEGFYLAPILADLIPKAHAAGIRVIAYDPPRLENIEGDVQRAKQLVDFRTQGQGIDAFAADIETRWDLMTRDNVGTYGARLRQVIGQFPMIGIVYPPNLVGDRFPFIAVAEHFDVLSPMSYWRARTLDGPGFMTASVQQLALYGKPVAGIGQAFSYDGLPNPALRGHPIQQEFDASIAATKLSGAIGMSFWVWEHAAPWVFDSTRAAAWPGVPGAGAGDRPPPPGTVISGAPPVQAPAVPATPRLTDAPHADALAAGLPLEADGLPRDARIPLSAGAVLVAAVIAMAHEPSMRPRRGTALALVGAAERGAAPLLVTRRRRSGPYRRATRSAPRRATGRPPARAGR